METILRDCWLGHGLNDGFLIPSVYFVLAQFQRWPVCWACCAQVSGLRPLYPEMTGRKANP